MTDECPHLLYITIPVGAGVVVEVNGVGVVEVVDIGSVLQDLGTQV